MRTAQTKLFPELQATSSDSRKQNKKSAALASSVPSPGVTFCDICLCKYHNIAVYKHPGMLNMGLDRSWFMHHSIEEFFISMNSNQCFMIDERIIFECSLNVHSFLMPLDVAFVFINLSFNTKLLTQRFDQSCPCHSL